VKLLWNTTNKIDFIQRSTDKNSLKWKGNIWGKYHKTNSTDWIFSLLKKINFQVINKLDELKSNDELIIVDSSIEHKTLLYSKLNLMCSKIFLFHLGDEIGIKGTKAIYDLCTYSWRTFCLNIYFDSQNVSCIPLGYKSGLKINDQSKENGNIWAFAGTIHKSSRHDLLYQLSDIKPNYQHVTHKFGDQKSIDSNLMSKIFSKTDFLPCPNGVAHPETYRVYEALECGCIPIVEDAYKYYDRLLPKNPFIKINKWSEAKDIMQKWNKEMISKKKQECKNWWHEYKLNLQNSVYKKINK